MIVCPSLEISTIFLRNAKSKSVISAVNSTSIVSGCLVISTNGCSPSSVISVSVSVPFNHNVFCVVVFVILSDMFILLLLLLSKEL